MQFERQDKGIVKGEIDGATAYFAAVRGGIAWATASAPAFYCILGIEHIPGTRYQDQPQPKGKIILLSEHQAASIIDEAQFIRRLTDDCKRFCCREWYADGVEWLEPSPAVQIFRKRIEEMRLAEPPDLYPAPYSEDFQDGFRLVAHFRDRLKINQDTRIHQQLTSIGEADLKDNPEEKFNAVNAFRYVLASFHKHEPIPGPAYQPKRKGRERRF